MSFNKVNQTTGELTRIAGNGDVPIDSTPTQGSNHAVQSGGTFSAIKAVSDNVDEVSSQIQTLTSAFTNNVNVNGSKNVCPLKVANQTIKGLTITDSADGTYKRINGTCTGNPLNLSLLDPLSKYPIATTFSDYTSVTPEEIGVDRTKTYIFARAYYSNCRQAINLYTNDGTLVQQFEIGTNQYVNSIEIDFSQYTFDRMTIYCRIANNAAMNNYALKPILMLKSDWEKDPSYVPYAPTNRALEANSVTWDNLSEVGAVNRLKNKAVNTTSSPVTWTVDTNKIVTATVESNLTATNSLDINLSFALSAGTYKLSGCPSGVDDGTTTICRLQLYKSDQTTVVALDNGSGAVFTLASDTVLVCKIRLGSGLASGTYTFYPMIAPVSYNGPYVPPAKTNKELTDDVANITKQSGGLVSYGVVNWLNNSATIILPRKGGLLVGGRIDKAFAIYVCENSDECAVLSGSDFVTATISGLTLSLTFTSHYGTTFNYKYINSLVGAV